MSQNRIPHTLCLGIALFASAGTLAQSAKSAERTIEDVSRRITELAAPLRSLSADVEVVFEAQVNGRHMLIRGKGTYEAVFKGPVVLLRTESTNQTRMKLGDQEMNLTQRSMTVADGTTEYTMTEAVGQVTVVKGAARQSAEASIPNLFRSLRATFDLTLLDDAYVDGRRAWVIAATPKTPTPSNPVTRRKLYFDQQTGTLIQEIGENAEGVDIQRQTYTNLRLNPEIDKSRFEFEPPKDARIIDRSSE